MTLVTVTHNMMTATLIDIATDDHLKTGGSHVMKRDNADVIHQVSSEIAIEAKVVVDDRGLTQTVMMTVNHGIGCDVPTMMFVTVIGYYQIFFK